MDTILPTIFTTQWQVVIFVSAILLLAAEIGFRLGRRERLKLGEPQKSQIGALQATALGLLALLLGFTFALAAERFDRRTDLILQESNSIGTTYLRASFLPDPHRAAVQDLLRRYIDVRIEFITAGRDEAKIDASIRAAAAIQNELWSHAVAAGHEAPSPLTVSFVTSLNETIDLQSSRLAALRNHVPAAVWLLVLIVAAAGCCSCGYAVGVHGRRVLAAQVGPALLIAAVVSILVDLDSPRRGLIGNSQQSLIELQESLATSKPAPHP